MRRRRRNNGVAWPDTAVSRAYLIALMKWAIRHANDATAKVTLPVGFVSANELLKVLCALEKARQRSNYHTPSSKTGVSHA
jgi:hypothetical protein